MMNALPKTLVVAAALAAATTAEVRADYDFSWKTTDTDQAFEQHMAAARTAFIESGKLRSQRENRDAARTAYRKLQEALELKPGDPEANYFSAEIIYHWDLADYNPNGKWLDRAIAHYSAYIDRAPPGARLMNALFNRSILYSKRGRDRTDYEDDFRLALRDYERQLRILHAASSDSLLRRSRAVRLSNAAELYMGIGELDRAIELYAESIDLIGNEALYMFGLAVALDRDGQRLRAAEFARGAIAADSPDPRTGRCALDGPSVFFVPEGDKSYYLALRAEVLGKYDEARRHYQVFLRRWGQGRFADVARRNLAALRNKADTYKLAPAGGPGGEGYGRQQACR